MVYQIQETMAIETIDRLKDAGVDSVCLWLHTSQLESENKNLNKMNMIVHLLSPLSKTSVYKLFFLQTGDILLIGSPNLTEMAQPHIERILRVLNDDPFIKNAGADFFTTYPILTHADLLVNALSSSQTEMPIFEASAIWRKILPTLETLSPADVMTPRTVLHLKPNLKQTICRLYLPDYQKISEKLRIPTKSLDGSIGLQCIRHIWKRTNELCDIYNKNPLASFVYFNISDIIKSGFDLFMQARTGKTIICINAEEILSHCPDTNTALKKLHANRIPWAITFTHTDNLELIDFTKIKPTFVCISCPENPPTSLPAGLKKTHIILTNINTEKVLLEALRLGYAYFSGKVINLILGNACQKHCPYGDTCAEDLCSQIWTEKTSDTHCVFSDFRTKFIYEEQENT
ncbi:MAG: hypothetical protein IKV03_00330 [Alphaproteobacteria bacterium]|nr:hypothetical protein [Alphaproteobacteria bacterium]